MNGAEIITSLYIVIVNIILTTRRVGGAYVYYSYYSLQPQRKT